MSFNVNALSQYVNMEKKSLLAATVVGANDFNTGAVQTVQGIKAGSAEQMKFFAQSPTYQTASCASVSGTTTFTEKNLETELFIVHDAVCSDDLTAKLAKYFKPGAASDIEIPNEVVDDLLKQIARDLAKAAWQGGIATGNLLFTSVDGWLKRLTTTYSACTFDTTGTYTAFTISNAITIVDDLMDNVPAAIVNLPLMLHLPAAAYNALKVALRNANYFNFGAQGDANQFVLPGYDNVTVRRSDGLAGAEYGVLTLAEGGDLIWTVDLESDKENIEVWYDQTEDKMHWRVKVAVGTEIAFCEQIGVIAW